MSRSTQATANMAAITPSCSTSISSISGDNAFSAASCSQSETLKLSKAVKWISPTRGFLVSISAEGVFRAAQQHWDTRRRAWGDDGLGAVAAASAGDDEPDA